MDGNQTHDYELTAKLLRAKTQLARARTGASQSPKSDRVYRLELERQPLQAGRVANASRSFMDQLKAEIKAEAQDAGFWHRAVTAFTPDFYVAIGTLLAVACVWAFVAENFL